jgi:hypothetical protein
MTYLISIDRSKLNDLSKLTLHKFPTKNQKPYRLISIHSEITEHQGGLKHAKSYTPHCNRAFRISNVFSKRRNGVLRQSWLSRFRTISEGKLWEIF